MTARLRIFVLLMLTLALTPALAGAEKGKDQPQASAPASEAAPGPTDVLDDIEQGWTTQNADLILRHFGPNKVTISIDGSGPGGSFSKDQSYYLFKELFRSTITKKFVFVQIRKSNDDQNASFAIAERRYQRRDDGRQIKDKVYIALHVESENDNPRWVVDEIKSIR